MNYNFVLFVALAQLGLDYDKRLKVDMAPKSCEGPNSQCRSTEATPQDTTEFEGRTTHQRTHTNLHSTLSWKQQVLWGVAS